MLALLIATIIFAWAIYGLHVLDLHRPALEALSKPVADWFSEPGNPVTAGLWVGSIILCVASWLSPSNTLFHQMLPDFIVISITVIGIDRIVEYRNKLQEKQRLIRQMGSRSNAHALDAAHIIVNEEWHTDGSLVGKNFAESNLTKVNLYNANLSSANLSWAKLQEAELIDVNLTGADLSHADLTGAFLVKADLTNATLISTNLTNAKLWSAKLDGAKLIKAHLIETQFTWASFRGTKLKLADIVFTQTMVDSNDLFTPGIRGAVYNADTQWPDGFDPEAAGAIRVDD